MDWIIFLQIFTIANKCLLFPLFWFKKNNSLANKLLALLILLPGVPVVFSYIMYTGNLPAFPPCIFIYQIIVNLFGPVFYYYCMVMIGKPFTMTKDKLVHLLPSLFPVLLWLDFSLLDVSEQQNFVANFLNPLFIDLRMQISSISPVLFALPYMLVASIKVYRNTNHAQEVFTNMDLFKVTYIRKFITLTLAEVFVLLALELFIPYKLVEIIWVPILGNILYFYVVYMSYNYSIVFSEKDYQLYLQSYQPLHNYIADKKQGKYALSKLSDEKIEEYSTVLKRAFLEEQCYLEPELNLKMLSDKTNIPAHYISQVINQQFGKNFSDYVNSYRVEDIKQKLIAPTQSHITIEGLAYMSGFNSKAAFQRAFKKQTGISPKEYRSQFDDSIT